MAKISSKEYDNWSKEELIKEIVKIKSTTYGLVWHRDLSEEKIDILVNPDARTPNEMFPNEMTGKPFPILKEVKNKAIESDKSKLVNLLIEGDNYHSLAVLNFTHREAIDLIFIDPPYNTGNNDFIYNDKIVDTNDSFRHSKWLSFMEKRIKLAKNLLKDEGVIFISIDDNEQAPLRMLCDEIFGEENFINTICWKSRHSISNDLILSPNHNFILLYAKNAKTLFKNRKQFRLGKEFLGFSNPDKDLKGPWKLTPVDGPGGARKGNPYYEFLGISGYWRYSKETMQELYEKGEIIKRGKSLARKYYLEHAKENGGSVATTWWDDVGTTTEGTKILSDIVGEEKFNNPKPVSLIKKILELSANRDSTVLDFFAGSGTTGHAVLEINKEDNGHRNFILCTNNENNICTDVCYPRVKKVISGYKNKKNEKIGGLGGNLKYYITDFVEAEPTDRNKRKLVKESTDMLCILENAFELIEETEEFKIFKNTDKYVGVVFYEEAIDNYKKTIKKIDGHFNTYVFSMNDDPHTKSFTEIKNKVTLCAIPEVILKVYREIFK